MMMVRKICYILMMRLIHKKEYKSATVAIFPKLYFPIYLYMKGLPQSVFTRNKRLDTLPLNCLLST